jgi:hypothetical protein
MKEKVAFIVGNGVSRSEIDLNLLVDRGEIFGCNALYRDFDKWDYLIAIDDNMITEVLQKQFDASKTVIIPPVGERFESAEFNPTFRRRSNAGMNAMLEAIRRDYKLLYCLGFDFILDGEIAVDNIYKETENYGKETKSNHSDNAHRIKYLEWFAKRNPDVTFLFLIPDNQSHKNIEGKNIIGMNISTFLKKLKNIC